MKLKRLIRVASRIFIVTLFLVGYQNCTDVAFNSDEKLVNLEACLKDPDADCGGQTGEALKKIQPAVAVRGISCLMCHAQIQASVITDFGYGNSYYWGGPSVGINNESWYNNYVNTWQRASSILGSVIVPNAQIPRNIQDSMGAAFASQPLMTIKQAMNTPYNAPDAQGEDNTSAMSARVTPAAGQEKIIAKSKIVIRSPEEAEISALAPALFNSAASAGAVYSNGSPVSGLIQRMGSTGMYTMNDELQILDCANKDIVVKGSLYLRGLRVNASQGCRIYVSGSIFIEDAVTYNGGVNQNLQLTSANYLSLGMSVAIMQARLGDRRGLEFAGSRNYVSRANQAIAEAQNIGSLRDGKTDYGGVWASIDYTGLLLNAPLIESHYKGLVKGAIIAEAAIFVLTQFHFEFDPVFTRVNALPLLKKPILAVQ